MMIGSINRRYKTLSGASLCVVILLLISSCSTNGSLIKRGDVQESVALDQASPVPKSVAQITRLETQDYEEGTRILIEGEVPMTYTSFKLSDPPRLVVDLAGQSFGAFGSPLTVRKGAIEEIHPIETDIPNKVARLEILLTESVPTKIIKDGNSLVIEVGKPKAEISSSTTTQGVPPPLPLVKSEIAQTTVTQPEQAAQKSVPSVAPDTKSLPEISGQGVVSAPAAVTVVAKNPSAAESVVDSGQNKKEHGEGEKVVKDKMEKSVPTAKSVSSSVEESSRVPKYIGKNISLDFQDAEITNVLRLLADVSGKNMVMGENVRGKISIKLLNVPWDQALDVILRMKGLGKVQENSVIRIDTQADIAKQQEDEARTKDALVKAEDLTTRVFAVNYAHAKDLTEPLKKILSTRGEMMLDERTNTLIVRDIPGKIEEVKKVIQILDLPTPQVLIEARIVQADTTFARDLGVQWGGDFNSTSGSSVFGVKGGVLGTATSPTTGFAVDLPASGVSGTLGGVGLTFGRLTSSPINLDLRLSAGESRGLTKIISSPKIATLDNKEAKIEQGQSIPYQTTSAQLGTKTEFVDATLTLTVTPKVTPDGHVNMKIKITKNRPGTPAPGAPPPIDKKEASTEVLVKDGETTVIGGIYEVTDDDSVSGVPWFYKLPIVGYFFKKTSTSDRKSELLIFITPRIITPVG